jgi:hypothetical protein
MQSKECEAEAQEAECQAMTTEELAKKARLAWRPDDQVHGVSYETLCDEAKADWLRVAEFVEAEIKKAKRETLEAVHAKWANTDAVIPGGFGDWLKREIEAIK